MPYRIAPYRVVLYRSVVYTVHYITIRTYGNEVKRIFNTPQGSKLTTILKFDALVHPSSPAFYLPFNMLTHLEVHHAISNDVTKVHTFSLLFGIRKIRSELGTKVTESPSSLRVFRVCRGGRKTIILWRSIGSFLFNFRKQ